nr:hypothetical protein [uncultured Sellimonas sp.]
MKRKILSAVLVAAMAVGMMTGCGDSKDSNSSKATEKETLGDTKAQLSSPDYEFEKEYTFGDFNAHSNNDMERQGGTDTFEDTDIVYQDISYDQLMYLLQQEGNYMIQLTGSWCHNSRAMSPSVNEFAKEYGVDTIYTYDFNINNADDGSLFVRMTNGTDTPGTKLNYMYGEMVSRYLTNLNDWVAYPADSDSALSYTNAEGKEVTVAKLQQPFLFLYNKDNTVDNSGSGNGSKACPIVYAFEEMVERDAKGIYVKEKDDEGNDVLDKDGNPVRTYITDEFNERLKVIFDYIKNNNIQISTYSKADYMREAFNAYGQEIFGADTQINLYPITYREAGWLMGQDGNALILFGGPSSEGTRAVAPILNEYAVKNNLRIYMYDIRVDGGYTTDQWGYTQTTSILDEDSILSGMYTELLDKYLTNLEAGHSMENGDPLIQVPYLFAYNKDAQDEDGFIAPVMAYCELPYVQNPEMRYCINTEKNRTACKESIMTVLQSYAEHTGIEVQDIQ